MGDESVGANDGAIEGSQLGVMLVCDVFVFVYKAREGFWLGDTLVEGRKEGLEDVLGVKLMVGLNEGDLLILGPELIDGAVDKVIDG